MLSSLYLILAASAYLPFTAASPLNAKSRTANLQSRDTSNCTNPDAELSPGCWDELDISDYLATWNRTTPSCEATRGDGSACCISPEPWTTCFLRLSFGSTGADCTQLNTPLCSWRQLDHSLDSSIAPKVKYIAQNIVSINNFFVTYYESLQLGSAPGLPPTLKIILGGNSDFGATLNKGDVAKAITAGLPFLGTPAVLGGPQQLNSTIDPANAQAFEQSLQNTPAVNSQLFGTPYDAKDTTTTNQDFDSSYDQAQNVIQQVLPQILSLIMSDVPSFTSWTTHALYNDLSSSSADISTNLLTAFNIYLAGAALSQSHFSATPASAPVAKADFQNGRTCTAQGDICKDKSSGQTYYWSQAYGTTFAVNEPKHWANGDPGQIAGFEVSAYGLLDLMETKGVHMPVLFDGAYNCTYDGKAGGSAVNLNADGSLDAACFSTLPIYMAKGSPCPTGAVYVDKKCPFGFLR